MEQFFEEGDPLRRRARARPAPRRRGAQDLPGLPRRAAAPTSAPPRCSTASSTSSPRPPTAPYPGDHGSTAARSAIAADAAAPFAALVFKTLNDPFTGQISLVRVLSGTLSNDGQVWNVRAEETEKAHGIVHLQGKQGTATPKLFAGDIGAVAKLKLAQTGDTLSGKDHPLRAAWIQMPEPAMSFAHRAQVQGRRGEDRRRAPPSDRGGSVAARRPRPADRPSSCSRAPASSTSRSRSRAQAALERRGHPAPAEGALPRDDRARRGRPRPAQEADRRARPVRRLQDQDRAAAARR